MADTLRCEHDATGVCGECRAYFGADSPEDHRATWHEMAAGVEACLMYTATSCPLIVVAWSPTGQGGL